MPTPESLLKKAVGDYLKLIQHRALVLRLNSGVIRSGSRFIHLCPEGTPDYLICCPDPRWIELKAPGQKTQKERAEKQAAFGAKVIALGHRHALCTSVQDVEEFLR